MYFEDTPGYILRAIINITLGHGLHALMQSDRIGELKGCVAWICLGKLPEGNLAAAERLFLPTLCGEAAMRGLRGVESH